jgi:predicted AlkP superfamily pyrophosphatase or phosphodiesterase
VDATIAVMRDKEFSPDLLLTYLPHLDYDLQRYGPGSEQGQQALSLLLGYLHTLKEACNECGYDWLIFGDYAIEQVRGAIFPNRRLREAGLVGIHDVRGMAYPDFHTHRAFAVVDHQVAHVYCRDAESIEAARLALSDLPGVASILDKEGQKQHGIAHPNSGELVLIAERGSWFAYPWFEDKSEAPDYAGHVDIHNKPGYDPCELFLGWPPGTVSFNTKKIRGSHGNVGENLEIAWSSSLSFEEKPGTLIDLADRVVKWMADAR